MAETFTLVTDGACSGNGTEAARGGWAAIVTAPDGATVLTGGGASRDEQPHGADRGARPALPAGRVRGQGLVTDSSYIANAISKGWLDGWSRKGWRTASKQPVANRDLWERMLPEKRLARLRVRPQLVRGHAGHEANERADRLAPGPRPGRSRPRPPPPPAAGPRADGQLGCASAPSMAPARARHPWQP